MPQQQAPWLETAYGWAYGENGWNTGMDSNLLKFSVLFDRNIDSIVSSLPTPVSGKVHYNTTDNRLYFAVGTTYFSTIVPKWFILYDRLTGETWQYNGVTLAQVDNPSSINSRLEAVELVASSLGSAAFEEISFFATQSQLDVVEAESANYTDQLRQDVAASNGSSLVGYGSVTVEEALDAATSQLANAVYVIGSGADQAAELSAALNSGKAVVLRGDILVASPVTSLADTCVLASNGASVKYIGAAGATHVLKFLPGHALIVGGVLTIDCDNKAGIGLNCRALPTAKLLSVDGVTSINCFQAAPSTEGAHGIHIVNDTTGQPDIVSVTRCVVSSVSRSTGDIAGSVCSGITAVDGLTTIITGNRVSSVLTGNGTIDADGIKVFSDLVGASYQRSNSLVKSNTISDCAGRLIKLQTRGKAVVEDNLLQISNIALIASWRGVDSQIADTDIRNNKFNFTGAWTGGSEATAILTQVQGAVDYTGQPSNHTIKGNVVNVAIGATGLVGGRAVMVNLSNLATAAATVAIDVGGNWITYEGGINSATKACNIAFTLRCPDTWAVGATNFMERLGGSLNTDLTGKLALLQISENVLLSEDVIPVLPWAAGDRYTSDLLIYGNAVGRRGGEVVAPFDFSRVKPGCEFNIGGGATSGYLNKPANYTYGELRHSGAFIEIDCGGVLTKSGYSPAPGAAITWTVYTL